MVSPDESQKSELRIQKRSTKIVSISLMISISMAIYLIESFIPVPIPIPGFKWGFSNFIFLLGLTFLDHKSLLWIVLVKVLLGNFLAGKFLSPAFFLSFFGNFGGAFLMIILAKTQKFGYIGISVAGAMMNNLMQVWICSEWIFRSRLIWLFFPYIMAIGTLAGVFNALLAKGGEEWLNKQKNFL